jgi:hypothetical protein
MRSKYRSKLSLAILTFLISSYLTIATNLAWGSCRIMNISLKKEGNFTKVAIYGNEPFEFSHSTEKAKGGKPFRVIIDCKDAIFDLPQRDFREGLPPGSITAIRTSQFQAVPERIVRVVLDLKGPVVYQVGEKESENEANISILTAKDPDFPMWVAVLEEKKDRNISLEKKQVQAPSVEPLFRKDQSSEKDQALLPVPEMAPGSKATAEEKAESWVKEKAYRRTVSYADTGEGVLSGEKRISRVEAKKSTLPVEEKQVQLSKAQSAVDQMESKGVDQRRTPKEISSAPTERALEPTPRTIVEKKETSSVSSPESKPGLSKLSSPQEKISTSPMVWGPFPKDQPSPAEMSEEEKMSEVAVGTKAEVAPEIPGSIKKGIGMILGPEPASAQEAESSAESLMIIQTSGESKLELVSQRKMIHYNPQTRRDPFLPVMERQEMSFGEAPIPLFENLRLVGILKDRGGNRALLEDEVGFGYILMGGDRIKNGYVIRVEDDRAVFHVEEYGGYQIMVLELDEEY